MAFPSSMCVESWSCAEAIGKAAKASTMADKEEKEGEEEESEAITAALETKFDIVRRWRRFRFTSFELLQRGARVRGS